MSSYHDRVIRHSLMWLNGQPKHNIIDDECVADFSCCVPELFTMDPKKRQMSHQLLVKNLRRQAKGE